MAHYPTKKDIAELQKQYADVCVSIYVANGSGDATNQTGKIELKHALHEAEVRLKNQGKKQTEITAIMQPTYALLESPHILQGEEGLAVFVGGSYTKHFALPPGKIAESVTVNTRFFFEPLQELVRQNKVFYLLKLGYKNVSIFKGDNYGLSEIKLADFPADMKKALRVDEYPKWKETHMIAPAGKKGAEAFHGQYDVSRVNKELLKQFFTKIDRYLHNYLIGKKIPLIMAGVGYELPIYKSINSYKYLLDKGIIGNYDHMANDDLHRKTLALLS